MLIKFILSGNLDSSAPASSMPNDIFRTRKTHGVLALLGWGLILPVGAIVARYLKHRDPLWYYLHVVIQFIGFIIVLAAVVVGTSLYDRISANIPAHRGIGIFALVLSILQVCSLSASVSSSIFLFIMTLYLASIPLSKQEGQVL